MIARIIEAIRRCRLYALSIFPTYLCPAALASSWRMRATRSRWIGGIVSVDGSHRSRFRSAPATSYYFIVLLLQFLPFSLCIGSGVRCGVELYRLSLAVEHLRGQ